MKAINDKITPELPGIDPPPARRGRKPEGTRAMTDAERAARYRARRKEDPLTVEKLTASTMQTGLFED